MATALIYVLVLLAVAAAIFVGVSALFGRGEELAPIPRGASPTWLPESGVAAADVRAVRFQQAVRGYRMAEVDWVLDKVAEELDRLRARIAELEPDGSEPGWADEPTADEPAADESAADETAADESAADESAADESAADETAADEPAADKPAADELTSVEPTSVEQPASAEDQPTGPEEPLSAEEPTGDQSADVPTQERTDA